MSFRTSTNEKAGHSVASKCCWTVGMTFEEWKKEVASRSHWIDAKSSDGRFYLKTACGRPTRKENGNSLLLTLKYASKPVDCQDCELAKLDGVPLHDY